MGAHDHRDHAQKDAGPVACAILTVSDTRTLDDDVSGRVIEERLRRAGFDDITRRIVTDDEDRIRQEAEALLDRADVLVATGGTGISPRDRTLEALEPYIERRLDGFGELFRMLSYREVGAAAMLSRAAAGSRGTKLLFLLPGSEAAVTLALDKLIVPELRHAIWTARGGRKHGHGHGGREPPG